MDFSDTYDVVKITINGHAYYIGVPILNNYLIVGDIPPYNKDKFCELYDFTIDDRPIEKTTVDKLINFICGYRHLDKEFFAAKDNELLFYMLFIDKYFRDRSIILSFIEVNNVVQGLNVLKNWLETSETTYNGVDYYDKIGKLFSSKGVWAIPKYKEKIKYWDDRSKHNQPKYDQTGGHITVNPSIKSLLNEMILDLIRLNGFDIYEIWIGINDINKEIYLFLRRINLLDDYVY